MPSGEPARYGQSRKVPGRSGSKSGGDRGKETGLTLGGFCACPVDPDDSVGVEPREGMTDQLSLFGERGPWCAPWEVERPEADLRPQESGKRRRRRKGIEPPGAEVSSATAPRRTAGYETRTSGGGQGARVPLYPISGGISSTTAAIAAAIPSSSSRPPSLNP